eukprot:jgi/Mesvir1/19581/Mv09884-RA.1
MNESDGPPGFEAAAPAAVVGGSHEARVMDMSPAGPSLDGHLGRAMCNGAKGGPFASQACQVESWTHGGAHSVGLSVGGRGGEAHYGYGGHAPVARPKVSGRPQWPMPEQDLHIPSKASLMNILNPGRFHATENGGLQEWGVVGPMVRSLPAGRHGSMEANGSCGYPRRVPDSYPGNHGGGGGMGNPFSDSPSSAYVQATNSNMAYDDGGGRWSAGPPSQPMGDVGAIRATAVMVPVSGDDTWQAHQQGSAMPGQPWLQPQARADMPAELGSTEPMPYTRIGPSGEASYGMGQRRGALQKTSWDGPGRGGGLRGGAGRSLYGGSMSRNP